MYFIIGYSIKIKNIVVNNVIIYYLVFKLCFLDLRNVVWVRVGIIEFSKILFLFMEFEYGFFIL